MKHKAYKANVIDLIVDNISQSNGVANNCGSWIRI